MLFIAGPGFQSAFEVYLEGNGGPAENQRNRPRTRSMSSLPIFSEDRGELKTEEGDGVRGSDVDNGSPLTNYRRDHSINNKSSFPYHTRSYSGTVTSRSLDGNQVESRSSKSRRLLRPGGSVTAGSIDVTKSDDIGTKNNCTTDIKINYIDDDVAVKVEEDVRENELKKDHEKEENKVLPSNDFHLPENEVSYLPKSKCDDRKDGGSPSFANHSRLVVKITNKMVCQLKCIELDPSNRDCDRSDTANDRSDTANDRSDTANDRSDAANDRSDTANADTERWLRRNSARYLSTIEKAKLKLSTAGMSFGSDSSVKNQLSRKFSLRLISSGQKRHKPCKIWVKSKKSKVGDMITEMKYEEKLNMNDGSVTGSVTDQRPRRNIIPKKMEESSGLSWREETELKKALYASLQKQRRLKGDLDGGVRTAESSCTGSIHGSVNLLHALPEERRCTRSHRILNGNSENPTTLHRTRSEHKTEIDSLFMKHRAYSSSSSVNQPKDSSSVGSSQHTTSSSHQTIRSSHSTVNSSHKTNILHDVNKHGQTVQTVQNSFGQVRAQRKFAQSNCCSESPILTRRRTSQCAVSPKDIKRRRAATEDFLTFLCLRGTSFLSPRLEFFACSDTESIQSFPNTPRDSPETIQPETPSPDPPPAHDLESASVSPLASVFGGGNPVKQKRFQPIRIASMSTASSPTKSSPSVSMTTTSSVSTAVTSASSVSAATTCSLVGRSRTCLSLRLLPCSRARSPQTFAVTTHERRLMGSGEDRKKKMESDGTQSRRMITRSGNSSKLCSMRRHRHRKKAHQREPRMSQLIKLSHKSLTLEKVKAEPPTAADVGSSVELKPSTRSTAAGCYQSSIRIKDGGLVHDDDFVKDDSEEDRTIERDYEEGNTLDLSEGSDLDDTVFERNDDPEFGATARQSTRHDGLEESCHDATTVTENTLEETEDIQENNDLFRVSDSASCFLNESVIFVNNNLVQSSLPLSGPLSLAGSLPLIGPLPFTGPLPLTGHLPLMGPIPLTGGVSLPLTGVPSTGTLPLMTVVTNAERSTLISATPAVLSPLSCVAIVPAPDRGTRSSVSNVSVGSLLLSSSYIVSSNSFCVSQMNAATQFRMAALPNVIGSSRLQMATLPNPNHNSLAIVDSTLPFLISSPLAGGSSSICLTVKNITASPFWQNPSPVVCIVPRSANDGFVPMSLISEPPAKSTVSGLNRLVPSEDASRAAAVNGTECLVSGGEMVPIGGNRSGSGGIVSMVQSGRTDSTNDLTLFAGHGYCKASSRTKKINRSKKSEKNTTGKRKQIVKSIKEEDRCRVDILKSRSFHGDGDVGSIEKDLLQGEDSLNARNDVNFVSFATAKDKTETVKAKEVEASQLHATTTGNKGRPTTRSQTAAILQAQLTVARNHKEEAKDVTDTVAVSSESSRADSTKENQAVSVDKDENAVVSVALHRTSSVSLDQNPISSSVDQNNSTFVLVPCRKKNKKLKKMRSKQKSLKMTKKKEQPATEEVDHLSNLVKNKCDLEMDERNTCKHTQNLDVDRGGSEMNFTNSSPASFPSDNSACRIVDAPTYRPSSEQFQDPIGYMQSIYPCAFPYGMCRIIPPDGWEVECSISQDLNFTTEIQNIDRFQDEKYMKMKTFQNKVFKTCNNQRLQLEKSTEPMIDDFAFIDSNVLFDVVDCLGGFQVIDDRNNWSAVAKQLHIEDTEVTSHLPLIYADRHFRLHDTLPGEERTSNNDEEDLSFNVRKRTIKEFESFANDFEKEFFKETETLSFDQKVEGEYWEIVEGKSGKKMQVEVAHIDTKQCGSAFPTKNDSPYSKHEWNFNILQNNPNSILRHVGPINGVTQPVLQIGMLFATNTWSHDPNFLPYFHYLHTGADIVWYCSPESQVNKLCSAFGHLFPRAFNPISSSSLVNIPVMVSPDILLRHGVSCSRLVQKSRQFVIVFARSVSCSISCGYNIAEMINFATPDWIPHGSEASKMLRECLWPEYFSMDQLIIKMSLSNDRISVEFSKILLTYLDMTVADELRQRLELASLGLKSFEAIPTRRLTRVNRVRPAPSCHFTQDDEKRCQRCSRICYISMVVDDQSGHVYCISHAIKQIQEKKSSHNNYRFLYRFDEKSLTGLVNRMKTIVNQTTIREIKDV